MRLNKRLKVLESISNPDETEVLEWIKSGRFYDELSDDEKDLYCKYKGFNREAMEEVELLVTETLHFELEKNPHPPTKQKLRDIILEVEQTVLGGIE